MTISVVIPAYNEEKYLPHTLESLQRLERKPDEIIVVDGSSTDKTAAIAKSYGVRVLTVPKKTIGYSRQVGLTSASGDVVAFTDADTLLPSDWLSKIEAYLTRPGVVGVFGGYRFYDGPIVFTWFTNHIVPLLNTFHHALGVTMATGQNMAFYKKTALEAGGFPVDFKISEDIEVARRLKQIGKILYLQWFSVATSGRRGNEGFSYFLRSLKVFWYYRVFHRADKVGFPDIR